MLPEGANMTRLLARNGGPFDIGNVVQIDEPTPCPDRPHVEDHRFLPHNAQLIRKTSREEFWKLLTTAGERQLEDIFGNELIKKHPTSCCTEKGRGKASLGCLMPEKQPVLFIRKKGEKQQIRMIVDDSTFHLDLGVTDLRLYEKDHFTPNTKLTERVAKHLEAGEKVILSLGLTRAFPKENPVHWLQINNIHFRRNPLWQLE